MNGFYPHDPGPNARERRMNRIVAVMEWAVLAVTAGSLFALVLAAAGLLA